VRTARFAMFKATGLSLVYAATLASSGCASAPEPTERLVNAQAALRAAEEVGANRYPQAQYHAQLAKEQLEHARKLIADGDNERAELLLRRASADAEVAVAVAREGAAKQETEAASGGAKP
jgi:hypothetical protein